MAEAGARPVFSTLSRAGEIVMTRDRLQIDTLGIDVPYFRLVEARRKLLALAPTARIAYRQPLPEDRPVTLTHDIAFDSTEELGAFLSEISEARGEG
jgi:hypothetical protein